MLFTLFKLEDCKKIHRNVYKCEIPMGSNEFCILEKKKDMKITNQRALSLKINSPKTITIQLFTLFFWLVRQSTFENMITSKAFKQYFYHIVI